MPGLPPLARSEYELPLGPPAAPPAGCLALRVRKVGWDGDDSFVDRLLDAARGPRRKFPEKQGRNLGRSELAIPKHYRLVTSHLALDAAHSTFRIQRQLVARRLAHQQLSRRRKPHD